MGVMPTLGEEECQRVYGMSASIWDEVGKLQQKWQGKEDMRYVFSHGSLGIMILTNNSGISADSLLCMQKHGKYWGVYASLPSAIASLRNTYAAQSFESSATPPLTFKAYFAASDALIGQGGQRYFEQCWREGNAEAEGKVRFEAKVVDGTDHDSIVLTEKGVIGDVFREVKRLCG
jgi:hypothetical protein